MIRRIYSKARLQGEGWEELGLTSGDDRSVKRHGMSNAELLKVIPEPLVEKYCRILCQSIVNETSSELYKDQPQKGCLILQKRRAQSKLHFRVGDKEFCFFVDDKHLLLLLGKGHAVDYPKEEISHDCHRNECVRLSHFLLESNKKNNERKECATMSWCSTCFCVDQPTSCWDGKHGLDDKCQPLRKCREAQPGFAPLPTTEAERAKRLAKLKQARQQIDEQITLLEGKENKV